MSREDFTTLGQVLDEGDAGLVVVYASDMADRVNAGLAPRLTVRKTTSVTADRLAADIEEAERARVSTRARAASAAAGPDSGRAKTN